MTFVQIANNIRYDIAESVGRNYLPSVLIYRTHDIGPTSRLKQCWKYMFQFPSHRLVLFRRIIGARCHLRYWLYVTGRAKHYRRNTYIYSLVLDRRYRS